MKKSVASFIASNRNLLAFFAVIFGVALTGLIAWQVSAMEGSKNEPKRSNETVANTGNAGTDLTNAGPKNVLSSEPKNQDSARGMYRGVKTAERFDVSPPLRSMRLVNSHEEEEKDRDQFEDRKTGLEGPFGLQDIDKTVQSTFGDAPNAIPTPIQSFDSTIGCGGCAPPDPNGDVGPNHFVAMGNTQFQIFNKTGT